MDKIRNNLPFEGELSSTSSLSTQPNVTRAPKKGKNAKSAAGNKQFQSLSIHQQHPPQQQQPQHIFIPMNAGHGANPSDQVTILSNFSEIIRASTSKPSGQGKLIGQASGAHQMTQIPVGGTHFPAGATFSVPTFTNVNLAGLAGQGITLPNNVTVQALLQSLQQQAKKAQLAQQQETPDSSQDHQNFAALQPPTTQPASKKRQPAKKRSSAAEKAAAISPPSTTQTSSTFPPSLPQPPKEEAKTTPVKQKAEKPGKKSKNSPKNVTPSTTTTTKKAAKAEEAIKTEPKSNEEDLKKIAELESQLSKCQKVGSPAIV
jgi:hypothetical protein